MKIEKWNDASTYQKDFELPSTLTVKAVSAALPGIEKRPPSADGKVDVAFRFLADGERCAIWRWKKHTWSAFGPRAVFVALGLLPE